MNGPAKPILGDMSWTYGEISTATEAAWEMYAINVDGNNDVDVLA